MASLSSIADGDTMDAADVNPLIDMHRGTAGTGNIAHSVTAVNDETAFAMDVKNAGTTQRALRVQDSSGSARLQWTSSGLEAAPKTGDTLGHVLTEAGTSTLTNKTLGGGTKVTLGSDATGDLWYRNSSGELTRLAIGSSGHVIESTGGLPAWKANQGGALNAWIGAGAFEFSTANFPQSDKLTSTNWPHRVLRFSPSSVEEAFAEFRIPSGAPVNSITANFHWTVTTVTNASAAGVTWNIAHLSRGDNEQLDTAPASTVSVTSTASTAAALVQQISSVALSSIGGYAAGELMLLKVSRSTNSTFAVDAYLLGVGIEMR